MEATLCCPALGAVEVDQRTLLEVGPLLRDYAHAMHLVYAHFAGRCGLDHAAYLRFAAVFDIHPGILGRETVDAIFFGATEGAPMMGPMPFVQMLVAVALSCYHKQWIVEYCVEKRGRLQYKYADAEKSRTRYHACEMVDELLIAMNLDRPDLLAARLAKAPQPEQPRPLHQPPRQLPHDARACAQPHQLPRPQPEQPRRPAGASNAPTLADPQPPRAHLTPMRARAPAAPSRAGVAAEAGAPASGQPAIGTGALPPTQHARTQITPLVQPQPPQRRPSPRPASAAAPRTAPHDPSAPHRHRTAGAPSLPVHAFVQLDLLTPHTPLRKTHSAGRRASPRRTWLSHVGRSSLNGFGHAAPPGSAPPGARAPRGSAGESSVDEGSVAESSVEEGSVEEGSVEEGGSKARQGDSSSSSGGGSSSSSSSSSSNSSSSRGDDDSTPPTSHVRHWPTDEPSAPPQHAMITTAPLDKDNGGAGEARASPRARRAQSPRNGLMRAYLPAAFSAGRPLSAPPSRAAGAQPAIHAPAAALARGLTLGGVARASDAPVSASGQPRVPVPPPPRVPISGSLPTPRNSWSLAGRALLPAASGTASAPLPPRRVSGSVSAPQPVPSPAPPVCTASAPTAPSPRVLRPGRRPATARERPLELLAAREGVTDAELIARAVALPATRALLGAHPQLGSDFFTFATGAQQQQQSPARASGARRKTVDFSPRGSRATTPSGRVLLSDAPRPRRKLVIEDVASAPQG
ncbi:hypothetical protein KFE25_008646 [Diacronema lutheri]|uniref:Uncharacterized protein n=1 Tax=Diacronema lutheri TaxID=2081491 RepID=A0A8J6CHH9_DIALT|nr:hypothetical protein KFE25_008646 [Diacronema lutheri]